VWFWKGNFNHRYGCGGGTVKPVERLILIQSVAIWPDDVGLWDVARSQSLFTEVHTPVVDSVRSDSMGFFEIALPAGKYSLLVREDSRYYASPRGPHREIGLVEVPEGGVDRIQIDINYRAGF
jgi:hypothetical protein